MTNKEVGDKLYRFTTREDVLFARLRKINYKIDLLPERLLNWRTWVQDTEIYLNELKNFVEVEEKLLRIALAVKS